MPPTDTVAVPVREATLDGASFPIGGLAASACGLEEEAGPELKVRDRHGGRHLLRSRA
jgi:hypothetical protein